VGSSRQVGYAILSNGLGRHLDSGNYQLYYLQQNNPMNMTANYLANLAMLFARHVIGNVLAQSHPLVKLDDHS